MKKNKYIALFESWTREETIILDSMRGQQIILTIKHGKIEEINNDSGVVFPFFTGQPLTIFVKSWACERGFKWNGKDACDPGEKKIFGIKTKYIPQGHELRKIYPHKFRN